MDSRILYTHLPRNAHPSEYSSAWLDLQVNAICAVQWNMSVENVQIPRASEVHCLPRITFGFNPARSNWTVNRKQFPLWPAYATTFNGSQDLTLRRAVPDLRTDAFARGQLYTALSRVRNCHDIRTLWSPTNEERDTANIIYSSSLL
ncbi:hypothetical protein BDR05DRAFT_932315 [Suillus weaverae]|nr:hypothetical protein BDR05DRAFT_932315 [Suillus weaverae]